MAVVTSKLDSKLPVASDIRWYLPTNKTRYNNIVTNEYRRYRPKLCFKQPSSKNTKGVSWQIKYRFKYRYTPAAQKAAKKSSSWTDWSKWRTPYKTKYRGSNGKSVEYGTGAIVPDPMYWLKGNRSYALNSTYNYFLNWYDNPKWMKADYDCIAFEFAVRSYKNKKHGNWVKKELKVFRRAEVRDEVLIRRGGGGLQIDFNCNSERDGTVSITSIVDASGEELLIEDVEVAPTVDSYRAASGNLSWYAYKKAGYTPYQIEIMGKNFTRYPEFDEKLTVTGNYINSDGVKTPFAFKGGGTVYGKDTSDQVPKPNFDITVNDKGIATVKVTKSSEFDGSYGGVKLKHVSCTATYILDGNKESLTATNQAKLKSYTDRVNLFKNGVPTAANAELGTWKFRLPLNAKVTFYISTVNELNQCNGKYDYRTFECSGIMLNGITYPNVHAAVTFNTSLSKSTDKEVSVELPYGRALPFAVYGKGRKSTLTFRGNIIDIPNDKQMSPYATPYHIKKLSKYIGLYHLRTSKGEFFTVALKNVDWDYGSVGDTNLLSVSMEMEEVSN